MNDDMLVKYLLGEASEAEQQAVAEWITAREEHRKYFEHFKLIWDQSKELAAKSTVNTEDAWQRFVKRTEAASPMPLPKASSSAVMNPGSAWRKNTT